jgi:hypothetical protein
VQEYWTVFRFCASPLIVNGSLLGPRLDKNVRELEEFRASFEAPLREAPQDEALLNAINNTPSC